jgi:hypothetical protein
VSKRNALGKGLGSLIPQTGNSGDRENSGVIKIAINLIRPNPNSPENPLTRKL